MEVIHIDDNNLAGWQAQSRANVLALGFFDGVHSGHQTVINTAKRRAEQRNAALDVMSFFPHPKTVLSNGKMTVDYLMPLAEKARVLAEMGVDRFYIVKFTKGFASLSPADFVSQYLSAFDTVHAVAGADFSYGFKGQGTINTLAADSHETIDVSKVAAVQYLGEKISSTRIRAAIMGGRMSAVKRLLGRRYTTRAAIAEGCLSLHDYYLRPGDGIYDCIIETPTDRFRTQIYVAGAAPKISFTKHCRLDQIDQPDIAITWDRRVAAYTDGQRVAQ